MMTQWHMDMHMLICACTSTCTRAHVHTCAMSAYSMHNMYIVSSANHDPAAGLNSGPVSGATEVRVALHLQGSHQLRRSIALRHTLCRFDGVIRATVAALHASSSEVSSLSPPMSIILLPTSYFLLPTSYFLLPTSYFLLPTSCLRLHATDLLPSTSYLRLPTSDFLPPR